MCVFKATALVASNCSHCGGALTHNQSDRSMHWPKRRCGCWWRPAADVHRAAADAVADATDDGARGNVHVVFPCKIQSCQTAG